MKVQATQCATCIYRSDSPLDLKKLEAAIADQRMDGHFRSFRVCHHSDVACCRGFWDKHKNHFDVGQIAQRLGTVVFVKDDKYAVGDQASVERDGAAHRKSRRRR